MLLMHHSCSTPIDFVAGPCPCRCRNRNRSRSHKNKSFYQQKRFFLSHTLSSLATSYSAKLISQIGQQKIVEKILVLPSNVVCLYMDEC